MLSEKILGQISIYSLSLPNTLFFSPGFVDSVHISISPAGAFIAGLFFYFFSLSDLMPGASERHSTRDKGHEEGGSAYAKAGSSLGSAPDILEHLPPKTRVCLLYCFVLSLLTLLEAVPHHHLALSVEELTYSSN